MNGLDEYRAICRVHDNANLRQQSLSDCCGFDESHPNALNLLIITSLIKNSSFLLETYIFCVYDNMYLNRLKSTCGI